MTTLRANCLPSGRLRYNWDRWSPFVKDAVFDFPVPFSSPTTPTGFPFLSSSNKHFHILFNNLRGQEYCPWIQRLAKSRENRASKLLHRGTLTTQLVGVQGHALNENLKRAAGARKKYNVKMFVFFHSRRSRPKKYYRKKPMHPNYYFNIV